jgi:pyruvate/2-oxoglutarate/acetoin dehydrogenase E1 component
VELIDLRTINPMDFDTVAASVQKTGRCVVVQEAVSLCSMASEISARIQESCFLHLQAPVQRVTGFDVIMPYAKLELDYLPDAKRIAGAIEAVLAY